MNTHRKTRGYGAPKTQFVTHRCVNFSHDWLKAAETWRQKKRREDILWHQQYFRPGEEGAIFVRALPLMTQDCPLQFTSPDSGALRLSCSVMFFRTYQIVPLWTLDFTVKLCNVSTFPCIRQSIIYTELTAICSGRICQQHCTRQIQLDINFSLPSRETSHNLCFVFVLVSSNAVMSLCSSVTHAMSVLCSNLISARWCDYSCPQTS